MVKSPGYGEGRGILKVLSQRWAKPRCTFATAGITSFTGVNTAYSNLVAGCEGRIVIFTLHTGRGSHRRLRFMVSVWLSKPLMFSICLSPSSRD